MDSECYQPRGYNLSHRGLLGERGTVLFFGGDCQLCVAPRKRAVPRWEPRPRLPCPEALCGQGSSGTKDEQGAGEHQEQNSIQTEASARKDTLEAPLGLEW